MFMFWSLELDKTNAPALLPNFSLALKILTGTNTLAYFIPTSMTKKSFYNINKESIYKTFFLVASNK
jgi:hypothetical protein